MPILIKRYQNRKLYNTQSKRYVTLSQIGELIKEHQEVQVIDNLTGEDITSTTLSQVIFEMQKSEDGFLPSSILSSLVQAGGNRIEEIRQNIFNSLNLAHHYDVEIERRINELIDQGEIGHEEGTQLLRKLLSIKPIISIIAENIEERIEDFLNARQIPTRNDLQGLMQKIDRLSRRVEEFNQRDD